MSKMIATMLGLGFLSSMPGTLGSAAAVPLAVFIHMIGGFYALVVGTLAMFFIGWWATADQVAARPTEDPSEIIIDELVGQWLALWIVSLGAQHAGVPIWKLWPGLIAAFVLFRLFDITKPSLVGWADRLHNSLGIMLDDVFAGLFAMICVGLLGYAWHAAFM
ncbi:Phosphatidylglycerophosphatase A [Shimia sp. SK013]|uniref:phosphatidylglycerophosphatase A family protein n=1 Tax=Shimia sp. SK013 TaxID=1389006 RepID=UPI0006B438F7|nr:phosphatidylglycerophosphatase A [Shimia sp. SK013]KPA22657.1 Phosphatidylglycerophosphatase A [Shimia sp. SK013]